MTYQEAEELIEGWCKEFWIGILKYFLIGLVIMFILVLLSDPLERLWEDFKYWIDCKKWDWENKKKR